MDSVALKGSYTGLLRNPKTVFEIDASGLHLIMRAGHHSLLQGTINLPLAMGEDRLERAAIDLVSDTPGTPPLTFLVGALRLEHIGDRRPVSFHVSLHNPKPSGDIHSDGEFGPVVQRDVGETPVSGTFTFEHADLTVQHAISGTLNVSGRYRGEPSTGLNAQGPPMSPRFRYSAAPIQSMLPRVLRLRSMQGQETRSSTRSYLISVAQPSPQSGTSMSTPERPGKTVALDLAIHDGGRVEDLLLLFTSHDAAAMRGPISLTVIFTIPPGPPDFLTRLKIDGNFGIARGYFTNAKTQAPISRLSESAAGESKHAQADDPSVVPIDIRASVSIRNGIASLPNIAFEAPGISGHMKVEHSPCTTAVLTLTAFCRLPASSRIRLRA